MKLVVAIVRPEKLGDVLEALFRTRVKGMTVSRVEGHGGELERVETYRGTTVKMEFQEKIRIEIGVSAHSMIWPPQESQWPVATAILSDRPFNRLAHCGQRG